MKKLYEAFNHEMRLKLKSMLEDINTEVDKETWGEPESKEHPEDCDCPECKAKMAEEETEEPVDNSNLITIDDEEEADREDIVDFLTKDSQKDIEPETPAVLSEFDDLSNEEKKALLLKLAKEDNNLDSILKMYMDKKCPIEAKEAEEEDINKIEPVEEEEPIQPEIKCQWRIKNSMGIDTTFYGTEEDAHKYANKVGGEATKIEK